MNEHVRVYAHFKTVFGGATSSFLRRIARERGADGDVGDDAESQPFGAGRDPVTLAAAFGTVRRTLGWQTPMAQAELMNEWSELAGEETAAHSAPMYVDDGTLVVQCDSTAWATQLRRMRSVLLGEIAKRHPDARVEELRFLNPGAPSWKRGRRSVPGRGPRDTYG
ncbi:UPF0232 protein [Pseudoclavibacter endophyticus]|uniref:DUF721 domain-containing protein n=1 Tax=Pseudoclavibacter endophyticus TaxID=1778590 RepID=A0A6H9WR19_9MICO|nr:DciA family protein [Pseudoclavibacter endophyticus]KAB1648770.1 DUF721 domain-containing protein [Pseudoclavibacter endophyticus]GGA68647.1 UPF0232 protein [Pseudoclavibacter endophyticus]